MAGKNHPRRLDVYQFSLGRYDYANDPLIGHSFIGIMLERESFHDRLHNNGLVSIPLYIASPSWPTK